MHTADHRHSSEEEELPGALPGAHNTLHSHLHCARRVVLLEDAQRARNAQRHRHRRGATHQHLLRGCCLSALQPAQAPGAQLSSLSPRDQPPTTAGAKLRDDLRQNSMKMQMKSLRNRRVIPKRVKEVKTETRPISKKNTKKIKIFLRMLVRRLQYTKASL